MTVEVVTSKKKATKLLKDAGREFIDGFLSAYSNAMPMRSQEPGVCWKAGGEVAFAVLCEFCGPNANEEESPVIFRLRTNLCPPPALAYHLRSPAVRQRLGVSSTPLIAKEPALEITTMPDEIGRFGKWLPSWFDSVFYKHAICPRPPITLVSWTCGDGLEDEREDIMHVGTGWRNCFYLWTPSALEVFDRWLKQ